MQNGLRRTNTGQIIEREKYEKAETHKGEKMAEEITEGVFAIKDFDKNKTWLINPETKEEMEVDEGLDIDHGEFIKMKEADVAPNLYCVVEQKNGKKTFVEAHVTNMKNVEEIKDALFAIMPEKEQKP